ncbi:MAG: hypothetical protein OEV99_07325, partial [Nitrospira sp.]|nr:hypothetical protein [Nitrospira sp.]
MSALSIEIDATQLFVRGFIIPGVSSGFHDSHQIQTLDLVPGSYAFQVQSGVISDIRFTVTPEGMVAYDESLDRCVSGRGTKRLTVEGFEVTLDAQSLSGAGHGGGVLLASVQSTNDDWISRKTCRLVPQSGFMVQQGSGQVCNLSFAVTLDGAFSYDAKHDRAQGGCLSGHGTPSLTFHGFPVNVDATAVSKTLAIVHQIWGGQPSYTGRTRVVVLPATFFTLGLAPAVVTSLGFNVDIHGEVTPLPSTSEGRVVVELLGGEPLVRILPTTLIGSLRVTPVKASPGEAVLIEALGADGHPADPASPIMINGVRGTRRYLQYPDPGTYNAIALAKAGDAIQSASAQIVVEAAAWPEIAAAEGTALLKVPAEVRRLPLLSAAAVLNRRAPYHIEIAAADTAEFQANLARTLKRSPAAALQLTDALSVKAYHWDFGDGAEVTTASGIVDHDFSASLSVEEEHRLFEVTCTIETAGAQRFEVKRTLSVVNAYAFCRNRGVVAPPVVEASHARKVFAAYEASITVHNPESSVLTLTSQRISYEREDGEVMGAVETLAVPFILAPNAITT